MNYVKKMCILRQIKQGFSGDGKALSGLIKAEQYGKNLAIEVSIINFAPLILGEYYCLLSDGKGKTEMLCLRGKSTFNILSDLDISGGFCAVVCHVKTDVVPIAYGINGNGAYDWKAILNAALPPVFPKKSGIRTEIAESEVPNKKSPAQDVTPALYEDDSLADENYYEEKEHEYQQLAETVENAQAESRTESKDEKKGTISSKNGNAESLLQPFEKDPDGYYLSVKGEIDELFSTYPKDTSLCGAFSSSEWVRIKGTETNPQYLVGVLYEDGKARYICYALAADNPDCPPKEIKSVCTFVPLSAFENKGFFVIFQSATSGECVKPQNA